MYILYSGYFQSTLKSNAFVVMTFIFFQIVTCIRDKQIMEKGKCCVWMAVVDWMNVSVSFTGRSSCDTL